MAAGKSQNESTRRRYPTSQDQNGAKVEQIAKGNNRVEKQVLNAPKNDSQGSRNERDREATNNTLSSDGHPKLMTIRQGIQGNENVTVCIQGAVNIKPKTQ